MAQMRVVRGDKGVRVCVDPLCRLSVSRPPPGARTRGGGSAGGLVLAWADLRPECTQISLDNFEFFGPNCMRIAEKFYAQQELKLGMKLESCKLCQFIDPRTGGRTQAARR